MAKKELKNNKSSSQEEEKSDMSTVHEVEVAKEPHKLGSVLRQIVDQIDDAERSNTDTLQEMQARLNSLSEQTSDAKTGNENIDSDALEKIETQIAGLSDRIEIISQGRAINADNLEVRIEALASSVSSVENQASGKAEKSKTTEKNAAKADKEPEQPREQEALVDDADITFAVTDQLEQDGDFNPSELEAEQAFLDTSHLLSDNKTTSSDKKPPVEQRLQSDYGVEHKIQVSGYDNNSQIAPQRLASLAEHFSPVLKSDQNEEPTAQEHTPQTPQKCEKSDKPAQESNNKEHSDRQKNETHRTVENTQPGEDDLEARFALIALRLEDTLAHNNQHIQEREEISTRFDELALKFENWLSSNDQKSSFSSIEQRIDSLTDYVRKAEANAARIEAMESQLIKLIDLVENNKPEANLQNDLSNSFEGIASRILEEKSIQIADIIASKVGKSFQSGMSDERLTEIQHSISTISAERRRTAGDDASNISAVNETLQSMSGRLRNIEEQIRLEKAYSTQDLKKNTDFEIEENITEDEEESDSFHDELELSVSEVIEEGTKEKFTQKASHPNDLNHQKEFLPPPLMAQEPLFETTSEQPHFAPSIGTESSYNEDYVAAARRASEAAYERNQTDLSSHPGIDIENEGVLDRLREQTNKIVDKGTDLRKRIFSFRPPSSTSIFVIGAISLMLICIGILFNEITTTGKRAPTQFVGTESKTHSTRLVPSAAQKIKNMREYNSPQNNNRNERSGALTNDKHRDPSLQSANIPTENKTGQYNNIQARVTSSGERIPSGASDSDKYKMSIGGSPANKEALNVSNAGQEGKTFSENKSDNRQDTEKQDENSKSGTGTAANETHDTVAGLTIITDNSKKMQLYRVGNTPDGPTMSRYNLGSVPVVENNNKTITTLSVKPVRPQYIKQLSPEPISGTQQVALPPEQIGSLALRTAAASGNFKAQFSVAMRYLRGERVKQNYAAGRRWLTRSASQSFAPAQYNLGTLYEKGLGVPKDIAKARTWYLRASNRGNIEAMHNLAVLYAQPSLAKPNYNEAILWFKQAANYGHSGSQYNLGILYKNSIGIREDKPQAYKWFTLALARGVENAADQLSELKRQMSKEEIFLAEAEIARWSKQTPNKSANLTEKEALIYTGSIMPPFGNSKVFNAQRMLNKLGYDVGPIDGQIGPKTRDAVKSFQLLNGMEATGSVTDKLIAILNTQSS